MAHPTVLISGIGIAGPTLAYWLAARDFNVTLVERAPRLRTSGYVIDFWGRAYDIAEQMGLLPELIRKGYRVETLRFIDERGHRVGGFKADVFRSLAGGRFVSLPRGDLAELIFRAAAHRCEVIFGDSLVGVEEVKEGVRVRFEHAAPRSFDLVVGADGLHSQMRRLVFGSEASFERYLGYMVAAFEITGYRPRDEGVYVSYAVPGKQVARFAMRGDRTLFLFVFAAATPPAVEPHDLATQKAILRGEFGEAGWECPAILAALDRSTELYFDRVSQIRMDRWSQGRVALVGDAAFCPSLLAGQGSALAMIGAYVLAGELARAGGRHEAAYRSYEALLRAFIDGKQRAAARFAASFAPQTRLGLLLRNQVSKAFRLPLIAHLLMGRSLLDRISLPDYPPTPDAA